MPLICWKTGQTCATFRSYLVIRVHVQLSDIRMLVRKISSVFKASWIGWIWEIEYYATRPFFKEFFFANVTIWVIIYVVQLMDRMCGIHEVHKLDVM